MKIAPRIQPDIRRKTRIGRNRAACDIRCCCSAPIAPGRAGPQERARGKAPPNGAERANPTRNDPKTGAGIRRKVRRGGAA